MNNYLDIPSYKRIGGIFAFLGGNFKFTTERAKIHNALYRISKLKDFKGLFSDIDFSTGGDYYKSEEVERIIDNMVFSRLLSAKNPDLVKYEVSEGLSDIYKEKLSNYSSDAEKIIKKASDKFKKLIEQQV